MTDLAVASSSVFTPGCYVTFEDRRYTTFEMGERLSDLTALLLYAYLSREHDFNRPPSPARWDDPPPPAQIMKGVELRYIKMASALETFVAVLGSGTGTAIMVAAALKALPGVVTEYSELRVSWRKHKLDIARLEQELEEARGAEDRRRRQTTIDLLTAERRHGREILEALELQMRTLLAERMGAPVSGLSNSSLEGEAAALLEVSRVIYHPDGWTPPK